MPNIDPHIERLSFWFGFLAATIFWWLVSRIKPLLPQWYRQARQFINVMSQRNYASVEEAMRRETVRLAQRMHTAAPLFALEEILVQPWLLVPPAGQDPTVEETNESTAGRTVPYLPDWPELTAPYGVPVITPAQAVTSGRNIAIIGHAGSGKTVALAQLAMQLARSEIQIGEQNDAFPIYLHANELDLSSSSESGPQAVLIKAMTENASVLMQPQIPRFLNALFGKSKRRVVLLVDGLDELQPDQMKSVVKLFEQLVEKQPGLQVAAAASIQYLDGLTGLGFAPLAVAAWKPAQHRELLRKWSALWSTQIQPDGKQNSQKKAIEPLLMEYWLNAENVYTSPLEWTLRLWGAYAGDLSGNSVKDALETALVRYLPDPAHLPMLEELAYTYLQQRAASLPVRQVEHFLSQSNAEQDGLPNPAADAPETEAELQPAGEPKRGKKVRSGSSASQGERVLTALRDAGILIQQANGHVRFCNPAILGFLGSRRLTPEEQSALAQELDWSAAETALQYAASRSETLDWVHTLVAEADPPLYRSLLTAARWLRDAPATAEWRFSLMRALVSSIQDERVPFSVRARMVAAFYLSRDPSTGKLFKQLLGSRSALVRRLGLLGCGALGIAQNIDDILALLADPDSEVRSTACMALAAIPEEPAFNAVVQVLLSGDEDLRKTAAESLALQEGDGHEALKEAAQENDLLTRRAAVYGLQCIHDPWAKKELEKIAVEDGQWIVRNAAVQALDVLTTKSPVPAAPPVPSQAPWLIAFASKFGMGILPGYPATDVLLSVLKSGSPAEQIAALTYLRDQPDQQVIGAMYRLLADGPEEVKEPVLHALWWMAVSGVKLPAPDRTPSYLTV